MLVKLSRVYKIDKKDCKMLQKLNQTL